MTDYRQIYLAMLAALLAGIAFALIFIACAAMAQERRGGGDWHRGGGGYGGGGYNRPGPSGGSGNVTINKNYYGGGGGHRQYYHERRPGYTYSPGYGWYNPSAVVGGAIGGWLYRQFAQPEPPPPVVVVQQPAPEPYRTVGWCVDRYKSYDPYTRTYLGYDGYRHSCP
jgi:hypothetical protein